MNLQHFLTNAWRRSVGAPELEPVKIPDLESLRLSERSEEFERYRLNRKIMGAFRYGLFGDPAKPKYDRVAAIIKRAELYKATGNDELLCDIANIAELEYAEGTHPLKHFDSVDDGEHVAIVNFSNEIEFKTSEQWAAGCDCEILDADGWDRSNFDYSFYREQITEAEFTRRLGQSTITFKHPNHLTRNS